MVDLQSGRGSADELLAFQRLSWSSLIFSLTRRCPLTCSHCITSSGPHVDGPIVSANRASRWAAEFPALAQEGLRHVTLTGGEPVLALRAAQVLAEAGRASRVRVAIVTSGAWASSRDAARRVVGRLQAISHWDLGYDPFHAEQLPLERFGLVLDELRETGASYSIRLCEADDERTTQALIERLRSRAGDQVPIIVQHVRRLGRATRIRTRRTTMEAPRQPCMSTGAFIREDGSVGPCCAGLAYEGRRRHPFDYGNVDEDGLAVVWRRWRDDQLLRLIRMLGLSLPIEMLAQGSPPSDRPRVVDDVCETCVSLWTDNPDASAELSKLRLLPELRQKLDEVEKHLYGSVWGTSTLGDPR